jgi:hypothetical protein
MYGTYLAFGVATVMAAASYYDKNPEFFIKGTQLIKGMISF